MITIRTEIHEGICKSSGGGKIHVYFTWFTGPRNLMKALGILPKHCIDMDNSYGNVGHCGSWIEVDGIRICSEDLLNYELETSPSFYRDFSTLSAISRTEWCKRLIAEIKTGICPKV